MKKIIGTLFLLILLGQIGWVQISREQNFANQIAGTGLEQANGNGIILGIFDYNNDGYEDIVYGINNANNTYTDVRLYKNNGNGTFTDATASANIPTLYNVWVRGSQASLYFFDLDNNGFKDMIFIHSYHWDGSNDTLRFFMNYNGVFTEKTADYGITNPIFSVPTTMSSNIAPIDVDGDGYLDIVFATATTVTSNTCTNGKISVLHNHLNDPVSPSFNTITDLFSYGDNIYPAGIGITDFNNDQKGDLVVCEQRGIQGGYGIHAFSLYANNGNSTFSKVNGTNLANASQQDFITVWDYNNDGYLDFINGTDDCCGPMKNTVWRNNGNGTFTDMSSSINPYSGRNYYGIIAAVDFNNDGYSDLSMNQLYLAFRLWQNSSGTFSENSSAYSLNITASNWIAGEWFDYDNDGNLDVFLRCASLNNSPAPVNYLMRNPNSSDNKYLRIKLIGTASPKDGTGSRVVLEVGSQKMTQYNNGTIGNSLSSIFHFGLGQNTTVDTLFVYWSSGNITKLANVPANQVITVTEETPPPIVVSTTSPAHDLALHSDASASDNGWGGGSSKSDITDGIRTYDGEWARGLAFWYGEWHQATIDFGHQVTFDRVIQWYHGGMNNNEAAAYKLQYWRGSNWVDIFETNNSHAYLKYPGASASDWWYYWSTPYENTFAPVVSDKLRILNYPRDGSHTWLYEVEVYCTTPAAPAIPENLTATAGNSQVTLKWNKNTEADFLRYRIYRGTVSPASTLVDSTNGGVNDTTKMINGLTNGTTYYFRVTAVNNSGMESGYSNEASATPTMAWNLQIKAFAGQAVDNNTCLGSATLATAGFDSLLDVPKPPEPAGPYVYPYFPAEYNHPTGNKFARDIKPEQALGDWVIRWRFDVKTNQTNTDVTLDFVSDGNIPPGLGILLKDLTLGTRKNLKKNGLSYTYNSGVEEIHHFEIMVGDSTPPALSLVKPNGGEIIRANHPYKIHWHMNDGTGIDWILLYYSADGGTTYGLIASLPGSDSCHTWSVPSTYLNHDGRIKLVVSDSVGNMATDESDRTFTIVGDSLAVLVTRGWNLMGIPLIPADSTISAVLADDISGQFWVFVYPPLAGYEQPADLTLGNGFWLAVPADCFVDVIGAPVTEPHTTPLAPGFNMISNPIVVPVPKDSLKFQKDGNTVGYAQAISNGWIPGGIWAYDKTINNYRSVDTLQIFQGYWLGAIQPGVGMIVTPPGCNQLPALSRKPITQYAEKQNAGDWIVQISTSTASSTDPSLKFGMRPLATDGYDAMFDLLKPPAPPTDKYVESYFSHRDWIPILGSKFSSDIRSPRSRQVWVFYVKVLENTTVTLSWDASTVPADLEMVDNTNATTVNLANTRCYTFNGEGTRMFTINARTTAVNENGTTPTSFKLEQNYPNPFNPTTNISFSLPSRSFVSLKVFDLMGREVATLVSEELSAGNHLRQWNAMDMPSGVYFYRLQADKFTETKGLILLR